MNDLNHSIKNNKELHLIDIFNAVKYRKRLFLISFIFALLVSFLVKIQKPVSYVAQSTLILAEDAKKENSQAISLLGAINNQKSMSKTFFKTQFEIIKSQQVMIDTAKTINKKLLALSKKNVISKSYKKLSPSYILNSINLKHNQDTDIITIYATHSKPLVAKLIANTLAKKFIEFEYTRRLNAEDKITNALEKKLQPAKENLEKALNDLNKYQLHNNTPSMDQINKDDPLNQKLNRLTLKLNNVLSDKVLAETDYKFYKDNQKTSSNIDSVNYQRLKTELFKAEEKLATLGKKFGRRHPKMVELTAYIEQIKESLKKEYDSNITTLKVKYDSLVALEKSLQNEILETKKQIYQQNKNSASFNRLFREVEYNQKIYELLLKRTKEAELNKLMIRPNFRVLNFASVTRTSKTLLQSFLFSILLGLVFAALIMIFIEYLDRSVKSTNTISEKLGIPVIGIIPDLNSQIKTVSNTLPLPSAEEDYFEDRDVA